MKISEFSFNIKSSKFRLRTKLVKKFYQGRDAHVIAVAGVAVFAYMLVCI